MYDSRGSLWMQAIWLLPTLGLVLLYAWVINGLYSYMATEIVKAIVQ